MKVPKQKYVPLGSEKTMTLEKWFESKCSVSRHIWDKNKTKLKKNERKKEKEERETNLRSWTSLEFSCEIHFKTHYFVFTVIPIGLTSAPFTFAMLMKGLV